MSVYTVAGVLLRSEIEGGTGDYKHSVSPADALLYKRRDGQGTSKGQVNYASIARK